MNAIIEKSEKSCAAAETLEPAGVTLKVERVTQVPDAALIRCEGYIDTYNAAAFQHRVQTVVEDGARHLVLELSKTSYISSSGVGAVVNLLKEARRRGGNMVLVRPTARVLEVFDLLGLLSFFDRADSVAEALRFFSQSATQPEIPYDAMQAITDAFKRLEHMVDREKLSGFYEQVVGLLKLIERLKPSLSARR